MTRDIVCLSHLRWDFVYQRPNHLMARAAAGRRVYYVEEPRFEAVSAAPLPRIDRRAESGVCVVVPVLAEGLEPADVERQLEALLAQLIAGDGIERPVLWYYTPMALEWTRDVDASVRVYDCMDFLAGFRGAPPQLLRLEEELVHRADVVFTGGARLHKRLAAESTRNVHCFPSSVDARHFRAARAQAPEPTRMAGLGRPRIGYAGVIDERLDLDLVAGVAAARPGWEVVLVGPTAKIDPASVPAAPNIHAPGMVAYADLPQWLGAWDIGWMPFAHNEATRYISPTKTPEYLAAGLRVVSTSIHDVVDPYGDIGLVEIADDVESTVTAIERVLKADRSAHLARVDAYLASMSWDTTWTSMAAILAEADVAASGHAVLVGVDAPAAVGALNRQARRTTPIRVPAAVRAEVLPASRRGEA